MTKRLIVTGQMPDGKSVIVADEKVEPTQPGLYQMWGSDVAPSIPDDGSRHEAPLFFPPPGGYRYIICTIAPNVDQHQRPSQGESTGPQDGEMPLGVAEYFEPENVGWHTTETIDIDYVLAGELWLELDDGQEVHLLPGDSIIQN